MAESYSHPYVPRDLNLPDFVPGALSQSTILGVFGTASLFVFTLVWAISGRIPNISKTDRCLMCWWAFTGLTHIILEGYFVFSPHFYKDKTGFFLAEVWKEYSKGDSRYVGGDATVVTTEWIASVIGGPASLLAVCAIAKKTSYSHILQFAISLGQLYGAALYFITAFLEGDNFAASIYYYYFYYVAMNSFWILMPAIIVTRSWKKICSAFQAQDQVQKQRKTR